MEGDGMLLKWKMILLRFQLHWMIAHADSLQEEQVLAVSRRLDEIINQYTARMIQKGRWQQGESGGKTAGLQKGMFVSTKEPF